VRTLIPLTTENMEETLALFKVLMGSNSIPRKEFIMEHAKDWQE